MMDNKLLETMPFECRGMRGDSKGDKGPDRYTEVMEVNKLQDYKNAIKRLGDFGRLFIDYSGCPRGPIGRSCLPLVDEVLQMRTIIDVDGGRWIPVNEDALRDLIDLYFSASYHHKQAMELLEAAVADACGYCTTCAFTDDCARHDNNDVSAYTWYYGDCDEWRWQHADRYEALKAQSNGGDTPHADPLEAGTRRGER